MQKILSLDCVHAACSEEIKCKFTQTFTNMQNTYKLDEDDELVLDCEIDMFELIQSNRIETLVEMYDKYVTGELQIPQIKENGEVIDFTKTFGKDKIQLVMEEKNQFNQLLTKYNLPETTTSQEFSDYIAQQIKNTEMEILNDERKT